MPRSFSRAAIISASLVVSLLVAGCSALRLGYGQGPELVYWWLDGYVDFDDTQTPHVRDAIRSWFRWHRATQLPDYVQLLERAQAEALDPMTPAQFCRWSDEITARLRRGYDAAVPALADIARTLGPEQIAHLERKHAKNNADYRRDHLQASADERLAATVKRVVERAESFYGPLDDAQREHVKQSMAASPFDPELWFVERQRRQRDVVQTLERVASGALTGARAQAEFRRLLDEALRAPQPAYRDYQRRLAEWNCRFAAEQHERMTPQQRRHAADKFSGWADDLRALIVEP